MNKRNLLLKRFAMLFVIVFSFMNADAQVLDGLTQPASKTPTLAYSLRKLKAAYTGPAVLVRNATNTESVDVYFDVNGLVSLNSPVSAVGGGAATTTTLASWIGSGTAFISTWYDQSGNARNAVNPSNVQLVGTSTLTTSGTSVTLGTAMSTYTVYDITTSAATTNSTLTVATAPATSVTRMAITGPGIPDGTFAQGSGTTINTTKVVNVASGATFRAYGLSNTYQPGNMLVDANGKLIGIIKSIESSTSMTLVAAAPESKTYLASEWGMATQPTLVKDGAVEFIPGTSIPAMRVYNGSNSNTRFTVTSYLNDGSAAGLNLAGVQNMNLFFLVRPEGNFSATNGPVIFGTRTATNSTASKMAVSIPFTSSFVAAYKLWRSTVTATTPNFPTGINTAVGRLSITSDGTASSATMYTSTTATSGGAGNAIASILGTTPSTALDNSPILLFGHTENNTRNFEGLASELIFYGSTTTTNWDETDALALFNNERSQFVLPTLSAPTATAITATTATLGATTAGVITARGTVFGTTAAPTGNAQNESSSTIGAFTQARTGFTANTKYYYRGYASNGAGTVYSADATFVTLPGAPTANDASNVSAAGFTANWSVPTQGAEAFTYTMQYGTASDLTGATALTAIASTETSSVISGLNPVTTYYYRVQAVNATGAGDWSAIKSVVTSNTTGLETAKASVLVSPNPALDQVTVTLSEAGKIEIYDAIGKMVYRVNGKAGSQIIPVGSLSRGLCIVKASNTLTKLMLK